MTSTRTMSRVLGMAIVMLIGHIPAIALEAPVRIMPLGDSLTFGEANTSVQGGYRNRLYSLLTTAGYNVDFVGTFSDSANPGLPDVDHQGWPGARTDQLQGMIENWLGAIDDPDVVLLLIGTNDIWQNHLNPGNFPLAQTKANLSNLIATLATRRPFAKIIVSNLPQRTDNPSIEADQQAFNADLPGIVAQHVALGRQVSLVDMHSVLTPFDLSLDGVHPSTAGYEKMADTWLPAVAGDISPQGSSNPPLIARVGPLEDLTHVSLVFSKPLADDAIDLANFSISDGLTVSEAVLDPATKRTITLTTSPQTPGVLYRVSVSGVRDRTAQQTPIAPQSMVEFSQDAITNGSFEGGFTGWTVEGEGGEEGNIEVQNAAPYYATEGSQLISFNSANTTPNGSLSQTFVTTVGRTYQLAYDFGILSWNNNIQRLQVTVQGATERLSELLTIQKTGAAIVEWIPKSYTFTADSPTTTLTFTDESTVTNSIDVLLDHVRVQMLATPTLTVTSSIASGVNVTISPNDLAGNSNGSTTVIRSYDPGTEVTVAAPASSDGRDFLHWQLNGVDLTGSEPMTSVTLNGNIALTAVYQSSANPVAPIAVADIYTTPEDTPLVVAAAGVLANDSDENEFPLTAVQDDGPAHGSLELNPDGGFTYTPAPDYHGPDSFSYHANNGVLDSEIVTVSLTVTPVNDPPVANPQSVNTNEGTPLSVTLTGSDIDGDPLTDFTVTVDPQHGTLTGTPPDLTYTPDAYHHGPDSFSFTVSDGALTSVEAAVVSITVNPVSQFGLWQAGFGLAASPDEDSDGDGIANAIEYVIGGNPANQHDGDSLPFVYLFNSSTEERIPPFDYFVFEFRRSNTAHADPHTTIGVEWCTDLASGWSDAFGTEGALVIVENDDSNPELDHVYLGLPLSLAPEGRLFARLRVVVAPP